MFVDFRVGSGKGAVVVEDVKYEKKLGLSGSPTQVEKIFPPEKNTDRTILEGSADKLSQSLFALLKERKFV